MKNSINSVQYIALYFLVNEITTKRPDNKEEVLQEDETKGIQKVYKKTKQETHNKKRESKMGTTKKAHPEIREGEIFIGNRSMIVYACCEWKTIRLGKQAYSDKGKIIIPYKGGIDQVFPAFLGKEEGIRYLKMINTLTTNQKL